MFTDYVLNGNGHGPVGEVLGTCRWDPGLLRPFKDRQGRPTCTVNTGRTVYDHKMGREVPVFQNMLVRTLNEQGIYSPVMNATSLRKEEWLELDRVVVREARFRMRAWADLAKANSYGGFNGMGKLVLEHETQSDNGYAYVDMDGTTEGTTDSPQYQLEGLPLPITHSDFTYSLRRLTVSRNSGTPLDTVMAEMAARRVAESVEKTTIGVDTGITYGGNSTQIGGYGRTSSVYGYLNFPKRLIKNNGYSPTGLGRSGSGWSPSDTLKDILAARNSLYLNKFFGPFMVYHSNDWDSYLDNDYILTGGNVATQTLRERLKAIENISDVRRLDFLAAAVTAPNDPAQILAANPFTMILVQMTPEVARAVTGQGITTVQWEEQGGMRLKFKVLTISVPQLRATQAGNCGIMQVTFPT